MCYNLNVSCQNSSKGFDTQCTICQNPDNCFGIGHSNYNILIWKVKTTGIDVCLMLCCYQLTGQPVLIEGTCSYILTGIQQDMKETYGTTCHGAVDSHFFENVLYWLPLLGCQGMVRCKFRFTWKYVLMLLFAMKW